MQVQIVDNVSERLTSVLLPLVERSTDIRIAVAFISQSGLAEIDKPMKIALQSGAYFEFLIGLDTRATEPEAIKTLYQLSRANSNVVLYCYASLQPSSLYHPKMYLLRNEKRATAIVGSSNLTEGGLARNIEVNVVIHSDVQDEIISDIYAAYNRLKFHPRRIIPDEEFLALYGELCNAEKQREQKSGHDKRSRALRRAFTEKASLLRHPVPTRRDLIGWLELVYDTLPEGEFTNQQIYQHEREFRRYYPQNLNIRAKIRQQLQVLRDMGFVEHLGTARWRKV